MPRLDWAFGGLVPAAATATAATTTEAATATATAAAEATAAGTLLTFAGDVDGECAAIEIAAVHAVDGLLGVLCGGHGDEAEAARAAGHAVHHDGDLEDGAVLGEGVLEVVFGGLERKVPDKQLVAHADLMLSVLGRRIPRQFPRIGSQIITEPSSPEDYLALNETNES